MPPITRSQARRGASVPATIEERSMAAAPLPRPRKAFSWPPSTAKPLSQSSANALQSLREEALMRIHTRQEAVAKDRDDDSTSDASSVSLAPTDAPQSQVKLYIALGFLAGILVAFVLQFLLFPRFQVHKARRDYYEFQATKYTEQCTFCNRTYVEWTDHGDPPVKLPAPNHPHINFDTYPPPLPEVGYGENLTGFLALVTLRPWAHATPRVYGLRPGDLPTPAKKGPGHLLYPPRLSSDLNQNLVTPEAIEDLTYFTIAGKAPLPQRRDRVEGWAAASKIIKRHARPVEGFWHPDQRLKRGLSYDTSEAVYNLVIDMRQAVLCRESIKWWDGSNGVPPRECCKQDNDRENYSSCLWWKAVELLEKYGVEVGDWMEYGE